MLIDRDIEILQKQVDKRNESQEEQLARYVKNDGFFKTQEFLTNHDMNDITRGFKLLKFGRGEDVMRHGEQGTKMYFIIKGVVTFKVPFKLSRK